MIIRIAIASKDKEYLRRLVNVMEKDEEFAITVYSDEGSLFNVTESKRFDVFMFTQDIMKEIPVTDTIKAELILLLDDGKSVLPENIKEGSTIKKYQRISSIKKQIFELYSEVCGRDLRSEKRGFATVISFYSPVGGAGKTTMSLMSAGRFAAKGHKVFYINLEDISSESFYFIQGEEKGMSDFMYFIEKNVNLNLKLQGILKEKRTDLFYLNAFSSPNDIIEMTADDIRMLISGVKKTGIFDVIVIDMGTRLDDKARAIFELSDKIVFIENADEISANKLIKFYGQRHILNECMYKSFRIINKDNGIPAVSNSDIHIIGRIGYIRDVTSSKIVDILSEDGRNDFVLKLLS